MIRPTPLEDQALLPTHTFRTAPGRDRQQPCLATPPALDAALHRLQHGRNRLARMDVGQRIELLQRCVKPLDEVARDWVELSCQAKDIPSNSPARAEEILCGPVAVMRQLRLFLQSLHSLRDFDVPQMPVPFVKCDGQRGIPVIPGAGLYDRAVFFGFNATTWLRPEFSERDFADLMAPAWKDLRHTHTALVLGAGNVNSIPACDTLSQFCVENRNVLLKMNPVNAYLGPLLEHAFSPLVENDLLQIIYGDGEVGAAAVRDRRVGAIHITGSKRTHDVIQDSLISGGDSQSARPITSELGSVSPWIVVPGEYSRRQFDQQAANVVGSLINNAGFNCVATRVIVNWKQWHKRDAFMQRVEDLLSQVPQRTAWYPNATRHYEAFTGLNCESARAAVTGRQGHAATSRMRIDGHEVFVAGPQPRERTLPWALLRNVDSRETLPFFRREVFAPVCVEVLIDAATPEQFLTRAVDFVNDRLWGTLAVSMSVPKCFRRSSPLVLHKGIRELRYGIVSLNQWAGLAFALMTPPWGGWQHADDSDVQSGRGWVHNTLMLTGIEKTVLDAPLTIRPQPVWQAGHRRPEPVAWALYDLMKHPSPFNLLRLGTSAMMPQFFCL